MFTKGLEDLPTYNTQRGKTMQIGSGRLQVDGAVAYVTFL